MVKRRVKIGPALGIALLPALLFAGESGSTGSSMLAMPASRLAAAGVQIPGLLLPAVAKVPGVSQEGQETARLPGRGTVFLKSLLIPGWGQYSTGARAPAVGFLVAEAALIGGAIGFHTYGAWLRDDYRIFAVAHAEIASTAGKNDQYWVDVGNFATIYAYNEEKLRQRNVRDLRDPEGGEFWRWDSDANRAHFENLRIRSDQAFERSSFTIAAIVANHVVSAIHAMWIHRRKAREHAAQEAGIHPGFQLQTIPVRGGAKLAVRIKF